MKKPRTTEDIIAQINSLLGELAEASKGKTRKSNTAKASEEDNYSGPGGGIRLLLKEGFFRKPKTASEVISRLHQDGYRYEPKFVAVYLLRFVRRRTLSRLQVKNKKGNEKWEYAERK